MAFIPTQDTTPLAELKVKLRLDELSEAKLYAVAVNSSLDYVVAQALKKLTADKTFIAWKAAHPDANPDESAPAKRARASTPINAKKAKGAA